MPEPIEVADLAAMDVHGADRDRWLELRRSGIGGSDIGKALGLSKWGTALSVWKSKVDTWDEQAGVDAWLGQRMEHILADWYEMDQDRAINDLRKMLRHPEHPYLLANIDRVSADGGRIVEVKCRRYPWSDGVPPDILAQVDLYMAVLGVDVADVVVMFAGADIEIHTVERDPRREQQVIDVADWLWGYVERNEPPPAQGGDARLLAELYPGTEDADALAGDDEIRLIGDIADLTRQRDDIQEELDTKTAMAREHMGNATSLVTQDNVKLASWSRDRGHGRRFALSPAGKALTNEIEETTE